MAGFKRTVTVSYGFVSATCALTSTKVKTDTEQVQLCTGQDPAQPAHKDHAPTKPTWDPYCPVCQASVARASLVKGTEVAKGSYVVMTTDEVAALKSDDEQYKGKLALTAHDAAEVTGKVMPSGTTYYLAPDPKDQFFGLLRQMIADNDDLAFLGLYTVTSRSALYRVRPFGDVLVAEQMLRPEETLTAPTFTAPPIPEQMLTMAQQVARGFVTPFDPAAYADTYRQRLAEAVATRTAAPGASIATAVAAQPAGPDPMAAMMAQMQAMLGQAPSQPKAVKPVKTTTARKARAKTE